MGACVYTFHALRSWAAATSAIDASAASSGPTSGTAWPWISTRSSPQSAAASARPRSIASIDSGSAAPTTGIAEITATAVSLPPSTRSRQCSTEKQLSSPHAAWGNPPPNSGESRKWVWTSTTMSASAGAAGDVVDVEDDGLDDEVDGVEPWTVASASSGSVTAVGWHAEHAARLRAVRGGLLVTARLQDGQA